MKGAQRWGPLSNRRLCNMEAYVVLE